MPKKKQKVRKSAAKRFQVTKTGKVVHGHQYSSHLKLHKSKKRLRRQKEPAVMEGKFAQRVRRMMRVA